VIIARTESKLKDGLPKNSRIGFVPTMGALHQGHLSLIEIAKRNADFVVVSIFINPLQFSAGEDFDKYPRVLDQDIALLQDAAVDLLFAPSAEVIYPNGQQITESAGELGTRFEGESRPGHFDGMLTVVKRLMQLVQPDVAVFGQKDAQQVFLVRELLNRERFAGKQVELRVGPTLREDSGLALSSRNRYLSKAEREIAGSISHGLFAANGCRSRDEALSRAKAAIHPEARLEYLELVDDGFLPVKSDFHGKALRIVACRLGATRLIDNHMVEIEREA
jgi:pantoate--beta-alanine ligase